MLTAFKFGNQAAATSRCRGERVFAAKSKFSSAMILSPQSPQKIDRINHILAQMSRAGRRLLYKAN